MGRPAAIASGTTSGRPSDFEDSVNTSKACTSRGETDERRLLALTAVVPPARLLGVTLVG